MNLSNDIIPIRFTITPYAKTVIADVQKQMEEATQQKMAVPAIMWGRFYLNDGGYFESVVISYYEQERYDEVKHAIQTVSGMQLLFIAGPRDQPRFDGKVLDYDPERGYFLRDP